MNRFFVTSAAVLFVLSAAGCRGGDEGGGLSEAPASSGSVAIATAAGASPVAAAAVPPGVSHATLQHDGQVRTYRLFVPDGLEPGAAAPLVVGLHGGLGSGDQFAENSRLEAAAQQHGFIAAFPDGVNRTWNGGNCCGRAAANDVDDVGFLAALIEKLSGELPVDGERVFMTGHSNGGIMSFRFGCERADVVAAIASVAGSLEIPACDPSEGVALLAIHGDADQSHPIDGGQGPRSIAGVDFVSQARSLELWTSGMGCTVTTEPRTTGRTTVSARGGCRDGVEAQLMVVHGADHPWPGGVGTAAAQARTSDAIDATAVIWQFFASVD